MTQKKYKRVDFNSPAVTVDGNEYLWGQTSIELYNMNVESLELGRGLDSQTISIWNETKGRYDPHVPTQKLIDAVEAQGSN